MAGTSSSASTTPRTRPASAAGRLSMSFSRQSWAAAARGATPSAASSAFSAAAQPDAGRDAHAEPGDGQHRGGDGDGQQRLLRHGRQRIAQQPGRHRARLVTAEPGGKAAASPGGTPETPADVASHHCVTWAGSSALPVRMSCRRPRSTMRAPPAADTVGNVVTAATIFTLMTAPLTLVCTVDPTLALLAAR